MLHTYTLSISTSTWFKVNYRNHRSPKNKDIPLHRHKSLANITKLIIIIPSSFSNMSSWSQMVFMARNNQRSQIVFGCYILSWIYFILMRSCIVVFFLIKKLDVEFINCLFSIINFFIFALLMWWIITQRFPNIEGTFYYANRTLLVLFFSVCCLMSLSEICLWCLFSILFFLLPLRTKLCLFQFCKSKVFLFIYALI